MVYIENIQNFINKSTGDPTGKFLVLSDYKNIGTSAFEQVLIANGYEKWIMNHSN